jgi:hypothetical protein
VPDFTDRGEAALGLALISKTRRGRVFFAAYFSTYCAARLVLMA